MPVDINRLTEGWLELESDPGLFTLLLQDFGVRGVQVEEIYDLQKSIEGPVYGFIFLFRWKEERRCRRKIVGDQSEKYVKDENVVNNIFFAQQMVPNSCATHALLSVLLNCQGIHLGSTLSRLKAHTSGMSPENKGWAIGNTPELARAHNSHAMPQAKRRLDKSSVITGRHTGEAFHFVSYVPIGGNLFELDGLRPFPMDHGPWVEKEDWTEKFRRVITDRLGIATGSEPYHDIRFNLMAVVPDRRLALTHKLKMLKTNRQIVLEALQQLVKLTHPELTSEHNGTEESDINKKEFELSNNNLTQCSQEGAKTKKETQLAGKQTEDIVKQCGQKCGPTDINGTTKKFPTNQKTGTIKIPPKSTSPAPPSYVPPPHPILETHNYAKSPLVASIDENSRHSKTSASYESSSLESISEDSDIEKVQDSLCPPDYSTPLTIQTSPAPSSSSTDTSSEVGSAFNSPTQGWGWNSGQSSPKDFKKFVVVRVAGEREREEDKHGEKGDTTTGIAADSGNGDSSPVREKRSLESSEDAVSKKICLEGGNHKCDTDDEKMKNCNEDSKSYTLNDDKKVDSKLCSKYPELFEPHTFAPKDLLALLKNLENEITICEATLRDENEKRKKYKIDDGRRTHNYDEFICTFLSMLAQQGKLADLVQQHLLMHKKQGVPIGRIHRSGKKTDSRNSTRRRRGRTKYRKRK